MRRQWIWFDFENTPHVLFLEPFIRQLRREGWRVEITAKPQAQTLELAAQRGLTAQGIGSGEYGVRWRKVAGALSRAARLTMWIRERGRPMLLVSSSRTASLVALFLRIPAVGLMDYEHAEHRTIAWGCKAVWLPDVLRDAALPSRTRKVARFFEGLKENLYLDESRPDRERERAIHAIAPRDFLVVARPPALTAHYASAPGERVWEETVRALLERVDVKVVVIPRNAAQRAALVRSLGAHGRLRIIEHAVAGPALLAAADLVLGGGGTMNREAAVLGVPVWSAFSGPAPRIDECLAAEGRLTWVRTATDLAAALAGPLPSRLPGRGPYPAGFSAIMSDVQARLARRREDLVDSSQ